MTDWTAGYVADIGYTYGYYTELNPLRVRLAFLNAGIVPPEVGTACELGFGQGMSANLHAAASVVHWAGTDFNPSQAGFAQELATVSGAGAKLYDDAFADFANRPDLPDFDFIGLHGIWSWINDENRKYIIDFIRKKLRVGGVLYISYNTLPGWAAFAPLRKLMSQHAQVMSSPGEGIVNRIDEAVDFAEKLFSTNPNYMKANSLVAERLKKLRGQNRQYLAHEYFNKDWHPMYFSDVATEMAKAKLQFACSAHYLDHIDALNLNVDQQDFLKQIADPIFTESVRDFMVNQQFRRDYWIKGRRQLSPIEQTELLRDHRIVLISHRPDISLKVKGALGEAEMSSSVYGPILDVIADHKVHTLGEIEKILASKEINLGKLLQAIFVLSGAGHVASVQEDSAISKAKKTTDRLNAVLVSDARFRKETVYLSSPVTGGGMALGRFQQLFLLARMNGKKTPEEWAAATWQFVMAQGQKLVKEGRSLETAEDNLAELTDQARTFAQKQLPILKALQVA